MISDSLRKRMESTVPGPHGGDPRALASVITAMEERFGGPVLGGGLPPIPRTQFLLA
jgi:hypothetical protein